jgi:hypothetical protein
MGAMQLRGSSLEAALADDSVEAEKLMDRGSIIVVIYYRDSSYFVIFIATRDAYLAAIRQ